MQSQKVEPAATAGVTNHGNHNRRTGETEQIIYNRYLDTPHAERNDPIRRVFLNKQIGHGAIAKRTLVEGDIVCEYRGTLVEMTEEDFDDRTAYYEAKGLPSALYQISQGKWYDAYLVEGHELQSTLPNSGVWVNHSRRNPNCKVARCMANGHLRGLIIVATKTVPEGSQLLQDYFDRHTREDFLKE